MSTFIGVLIATIGGSWIGWIYRGIEDQPRRSDLVRRLYYAAHSGPFTEALMNIERVLTGEDDG